MPSEFNEYLPKDCEEYKRWKASREAGVSGAMAGLAVDDGGGGGAAADGAAGAGPAAAAAAAAAPEKKSSSKKKKSNQPEVVLERNTRNKKKCITTISGLDAFGVKLGEASKLFGKKFASGASVVKNAEGKEHIDVQVRVGLGVGWEGAASAALNWEHCAARRCLGAAAPAPTVRQPAHLPACLARLPVCRETAWTVLLS